MTMVGPSSASTSSARLFGGFWQPSSRRRRRRTSPSRTARRSRRSMRPAGRDPDVSTPCGANRPVASPRRSGWCRGRAPRRPWSRRPRASGAREACRRRRSSTHSSVQPQTSSKRSLIGRARPVFAREAAVGVDGQHRLLLRVRRRGEKRQRQATIGNPGHSQHRLLLPDAVDDPEAAEKRGTEAGSGSRHDLNPSAGMIRIRFDGSAEFSASQPLGHPVR